MIRTTFAFRTATTGTLRIATTTRGFVWWRPPLQDPVLAPSLVLREIVQQFATDF